ncbi:MAG: FixH family protein [Catalinimonas sp.]
MNWGHKIALGYAGFVALIVTLVVLCVRQDMPLVAVDYYRQEIEYQDRIDQIENARTAEEALRFDYDGRARRLVVGFPDGAEGEVHFFRPDDAQRDFRVAVAPNAAGQQEIDLVGRRAGLWRVKMTWRVGEQAFYDERRVVL